MDFDTFLQYVPKIKVESLTGAVSHEKMSPPERLELLKNYDINTFEPREAAVMMLLYPKDAVTHLVLIVRNAYQGVHSAQIGFPGGKVELTDRTLAHTALRETEEEIGISEANIQVIKAFSEVYIPPSNFRVYPFLGFSITPLVFVPDPREVFGIIELPLSDFMDDRILMTQKMSTSYMKEIVLPVFKIQDHIVWGATAMMLRELRDVLNSVMKT